jgi:hypothetical protein
MDTELKACDRCHQHQAMHQRYHAGGIEHLCCGCYVRAGNPPADWHRVCVQTWNELHPDRHMDKAPPLRLARGGENT